MSIGIAESNCKPWERLRMRISPTKPIYVGCGSPKAIRVGIILTD
jgi:hypothetical protein